MTNISDITDTNHCTYGCCTDNEVHQILAELESETRHYPPPFSWEQTLEAEKEFSEALQEEMEEEQRSEEDVACNCGSQKNNRTGHSLWCARILQSVQRGGGHL